MLNTKKNVILTLLVLLLLVITNYGSYRYGMYVNSVKGHPAAVLFSYHPIIERLSEIENEELLRDIRRQISNSTFLATLAYNDYSKSERNRIKAEFNALKDQLERNDMTLLELIDIEHNWVTSEENIRSMQNFIVNSFDFIVKNDISKDLPHEFVGFSE